MSLKSTDYALLSKDAYSPRSIGEKVNLGSITYTVLDSIASSNLGFQATAYRTPDNSELVIAYRGTEFNREPFRDGAVDAAMVFAGFNPQDASAQTFTRQMIDAARRDDEKTGATTHITVTGHSLGGTLAQLNAARFGLDGHTFNAYGAKGLDTDVVEATGKVVNHARAGDPVSAASPHLGSVKIYAAQRDVDRIGAAGYDHNDRFNNMRTVLAVDSASHGIENFIPNNPVLGNSILNAEAEARYRSNQELIDRYRSDVHTIRSHASVAWETRRAVKDHITTAGKYAVEQAQRGGQAIAVGAAAGAIRTYDAAAEAARDVSERGERAGSFMVEGMRALDMVPEPSATTVWGPRTGSTDLDRLLDPPKLNDANHPDHAMFEQARRCVHELDAKSGRSPDQMSENLAGSLTVEARRQGLTRIDHVALTDDFSRAFAVQGELNSPFKKHAEVPTEIGIATSIERSSSNLRDLASQGALPEVVAPQLAQQPSFPTTQQQNAIQSSAPSMTR